MKNRLTPLLATLLLLDSCASHKTSIFDGKVVQSGDVYSLPRTSFKVAVKKADNALSYSIVPAMEADREFRFSLKSSTNPFFDVKHKTTISNGLLTTVNSEDKGQLDEFLKASVSAVMTPGMLSTGGVGNMGATNLVSKQDLRLTTEEYLELLKRVPNGDHSFDLTPGRSYGEMALPGTDGVLRVTILKIRGTQRVSRYRVDQEVFKTNQYLTPDSTSPADGVLARSVIPVSLIVALRTNEQALKAWRTARAHSLEAPSPDSPVYDRARKAADELTKDLTEELELARKRRAATEKAVAELTDRVNAATETDKAALQKELTAAIAARDAASKRRSDLASELGKAEGDVAAKDLQLNALDAPKLLAGRQMTAYKSFPNGLPSQVLFNQTFNQMQADESYVILIPMNRALMGTTKNQLALSSGVVTDHTREMESQALAFIKLPTTIAKEIVSVPGALFTSAGTTTKARKDLIDAQSALIDSQLKRIETLKKLQPPSAP